jgi:hypothetical protein
MMELAINTMTADSRMGSHRAAKGTIGSLLMKNLNQGEIGAEAIFFISFISGGQGSL